MDRPDIELQRCRQEKECSIKAFAYPPLAKWHEKASAKGRKSEEWQRGYFLAALQRQIWMFNLSLRLIHIQGSCIY
jgi:hypothetical protein